MMALSLLFMFFFPPLFHLWLIIRKFRHATTKSMTVLTLMAIGLQVVLTIVAATIYDQQATSTTAYTHAKCDMTPVIFIVFEPMVAFFIMPVIGVVSAIIWNLKKTKAIDQLKQPTCFQNTSLSGH